MAINYRMVNHRKPSLITFSLKILLYPSLYYKTTLQYFPELTSVIIFQLEPMN